MSTRTLSPKLLRSAREDAGMSVAGAAANAEVSPGTIRNAERGAFAPRADALARMADAYGVQIDSLFVHDQEADMPSTAHGKPNGGAAAGSRSTPIDYEGA